MFVLHSIKYSHGEKEVIGECLSREAKGSMLNCRRVWRTCDGLGERAFSIRPRQFMVLKMLILGLESHGWVSIRSITRPLSLLE